MTSMEIVNNTFCFKIKELDTNEIMILEEEKQNITSLILLPMYWKNNNNEVCKKYYAISEDHLEMSSIDGKFELPKYIFDIDHNDTVSSNTSGMDDSELMKFNDKTYCKSFISRQCKRKNISNIECIGEVSNFKYERNIGNVSYARWTISYYKFPRLIGDKCIKNVKNLRYNEMLYELETQN